MRLFFAAPADFSALSQRHQAFARLLADRGFLVFYLEPLRSPGFGCRISSAGNCLRVVSLRMPFRAANSDFFHNAVVGLSLALLKRKFKINDSDVLWMAEPSMAALAACSWSKIIYDRCDLHGFFPGQTPSAWQRYESVLFSRADHILASHQRLLQDIPSDFRAKGILVGNACADEIRAVAGGRSEGRLRLVSSGAHFDWVDCDWLAMLAQHAGVELHVAGSGRGQAFERLIALDSVKFHGKLNQSELFELYRHSDVGLVPFADIELISAVDPIKVYEFAAAGLRVWAKPVAGLRENVFIDRFIGSYTDLEEAVAGFHPVLQAKPVPRWSERLQTILDKTGLLRSD
ncbi:MAG: glycosyltransferase [Candidatus Rifleibacteriota bacterium]